MQGNTREGNIRERRGTGGVQAAGQARSEKRRGAVIAAGVMIVLVLLFVGLLAMLIAGEEDVFLDGILWLYIGGGLAVIGGVLLALKQRFGEIRRGEEEEAKKY